MNERPIGAIATVAAALVLLALLSSGGGYGRLLRAPLDFTAFRCAGQIVAHGGNPYRVEPLRQCEASALGAVGKHATRFLVVPAPFPPYALLAFSFFGNWRPSGIWAFILLGSLVAGCAFLRPLTRAPLWCIVLPLAGAGFLASLVVGQVIPVEIALLTIVAASVHARRPVTAAVAAAAAMLEPQLGLPICVALALTERRARAPLALALTALAGLSLAPGGIHLDWEYVNAVIPQAALTEGLDASIQFSLSAQLALLGMPPALASAVGILSYGVMIGIGVRVGQILSKKFAEPAFAIVAPSAFALLGGFYAHLHHMAMALPLALLLIGRIRPAPALAVAIVLLGVPWETIAAFWFYQPAAAHDLAAAVHAMDLVDDGAGATAAGVWSAWIGAGGGRAAHSFAFSAATKLPTWLGLVMLLGLSLHAPARAATRFVPVRHPPPRV